MKRIEIVVWAAVAAFGLSATAAGSAFALPEVGRCAASAGGKYADSNCASKTTKGNGSFEFFKGAERTGFSSVGGEAVLETASGTDIRCSAEHAAGKYDADGAAGAIKGVESVVLVFTRCTVPIVDVQCSTPGAAPAEIVTNALEGNFGYISGERTGTPVVGLELRPEARHEAFAEEVVCGGGAAVVVFTATQTNCVIARVSPVNTASTSLVENYSTSSRGSQTPNHFQRTPSKICQLEDAVNGGPSESLALNFESTITNEEALKIKA